MTVAPLSKRIYAYLVDISILGIILYVVYLFLPSSQNVAVLNLELNSINELAVNHEISIMTYINRYADIMHDLDKQQVMASVLNCCYIFIYFIGVPYFWEGRTLGKRLFHIRSIRKDGSLLAVSDLLTRNLIINGLGFTLISLCMLYILPSIVYFVFSSILGILQIILVIISLFMVIYRSDKRGLHDILGNSIVVMDDGN